MELIGIILAILLIASIPYLIKDSGKNKSATIKRKVKFTDSEILESELSFKRLI